MRRMISQKLQDLLKKLSQSIWTNEDGDLEVGRNLEVDGEIQVNGPANFTSDAGVGGEFIMSKGIDQLEFNGGDDSLEDYLNQCSKAKYHHLIVIGGSNSDGLFSDIVIDTYLSKNTPIDSIQDLTTLLGGARYLCTGTLKYDADTDGESAIFITIGNSVSDIYINDSFDDKFSFSECFSTIETFTDDVSIPR